VSSLNDLAKHCHAGSGWHCWKLKSVNYMKKIIALGASNDETTPVFIKV
jgi:hypothetical protein